MKTNRFRSMLASLPLLLALFSPLCVSAQCRDPWINQAYRELGRTPVGQGEAGVCNIKLYNNGTWGAYPELKGYVQQYINSGITTGYLMLPNGNSAFALKTSDGMVAIGVLDASGKLVASGGGNLVASGAGNLVASGGGNLVASGAGNFQGLINVNTPGLQFSSGYTLQSGERKRVKTSGNGAIVIR